MANSIVFFTQSIGSFEIDATLEETHTETLNLTRYPVEEGSQISDHAQIMPRRFDIVAGKTNFPNSYNPTLVSDAYETLLGVFRKRDLLTVITGLTVLENMVIENFSITQDKDTANVGFFIVHLKEVIIVGTGISQSSGSFRATSSEGTSPNQNTGPLPPPTLEEQQTENRASPSVENFPGANLSQWQLGPDGYILSPNQPNVFDQSTPISTTEANRLISLAGG